MFERANLLSLQNATIAAKRNLNLLLARTPETPFEVAEDLTNTYAPDRARLLQNLLAQNPALLSLQKSADVQAFAGVFHIVGFEGEQLLLGLEEG